MDILGEKLAKCVRCDTETDNDFGKETMLYIKDVQARHLCDDCVIFVNESLGKFLVNAPMKLTPKEQESEDYFG